MPDSITLSSRMPCSVVYGPVNSNQLLQMMRQAVINQLSKMQKTGIIRTDTEDWS